MTRQDRPTSPQVLATSTPSYRRAGGVRGWAGRVDATLLRHVMTAGSPATDRLFVGLSQAANRSALWWGAAALLGGVGGRRGRRAAAGGMLAVGVASALVNGPLKLLSRRPRPAAVTTGAWRTLLRMPGSFSFPSGHTASAFAFTTAAALALPATAAPLGLVAAAVGYSRVRTGVHFPSDVLAGAGIGVLTGALAHRLLARRQAPTGVTVAGAAGLPRRAVLVTNGNAGSADHLDRARRAMLGAGVEILAEIPVAEAARLAEWLDRNKGGDGQFPLVVAAGGDGTVGAAADVVAQTPAVLAVLPLGTSNDVARSLGVPSDPAAAARLLTQGKISTIDAGRLSVEGRPVRHFVHAATIGLNVEFAKLATQASMRKRFGRLTYLVAALTSLPGYRPFECTLCYDGQQRRLRLVQLSVINAPAFGGALGLRISGSSVDDRALDVIAVEHGSLIRLLVAAVGVLAGRTGKIRGAHRLRLRDLAVQADRDLEVALDGEVCATLPARFAVAGEALRVVTPWDFEDFSAPSKPTRRWPKPAYREACS